VQEILAKWNVLVAHTHTKYIYIYSFQIGLLFAKKPEVLPSQKVNWASTERFAASRSHRASRSSSSAMQSPSTGTVSYGTFPLFLHGSDGHFLEFEGKSFRKAHLWISLVTKILAFL
jgi:hypothetical protein